MTNSNIAVFKSIFGELAKFSAKVETLLEQHEKDLSTKRVASTMTAAARKRQREELEPNAPKHPMSSFLLFAQDYRLTNPDCQGKHMTTAAGQFWRCSRAGAHSISHNTQQTSELTSS